MGEETDIPGPKAKAVSAFKSAAAKSSAKNLPKAATATSDKPSVPPGTQSVKKKSQQNVQKPQKLTNFYAVVQQAKSAHKPESKREKVKETFEKLKGNVDLEEETSRWAIIYKKLGIHHWGMIIVVVLYAFIGAGIFEAVEGPAEVQQKIQDEIAANESARQLLARIRNVTHHVAQKPKGSKVPPECTKLTINDDDVLALIREFQEKHNLGPSEKTNWDFWGSMFYAGTLFTTIGYGHYAPATDLGRALTMIYAFIGIPLVLAALNDIGALLTRTIKTPWNFVRGGIHRAWHKFKRERRKRNISVSTGNLASGVPLQKHGLQVPGTKEDKTSDIVDWPDESSDEITEFNFPVPVALCLFLLWIIVCAPIFCIWEDWSYFKSFYFFFISLTTIGLGDVVPERPKLTILMFPLVLMGLSLISMCINLMQQRMAEWKDEAMDNFADYMGWSSETESSDEGSEDEFGNIRLKPPKPPKPDGPHPQHGSPEPTGATLGIFQTTAAEPTPEPNDSARAFLGKWRAAQQAKSAARLSAKAPEVAKPPTVHPSGLVPQKRKRRGIQTDESYIRVWKRDMRRRFPGVPFHQIQNITPRSHDDVSSLVDETDVTFTIKPA